MSNWYAKMLDILSYILYNNITVNNYTKGNVMAEYKHILIKPETKQRFKVAAVKAGMTYDEYIKYLLNLGQAYPPNIDAKNKAKQS